MELVALRRDVRFHPGPPSSEMVHLLARLCRNCWMNKKKRWEERAKGARITDANKGADPGILM